MNSNATPASFGSEPARRNRWRAVLLTVCVLTGIALIALLINEAGLGAPPWFGLWGAQFAASGTPYAVTAESIDPHGASAKGGLRRNDVIDLRAATLLERFAILSQPVSEQPIAVTVRRGAGTARLTIVPTALTAERADIPISTAGTLLLVLFAGLILMRRAFVPGNLLLSATLLCLAIGTAVGAPTVGFGAPWVWPYVLAGICAPAGAISVALWAKFANGFAAGELRGVRRLALWACYASCAVAVAIDLAFVAGMTTMWLDPAPLVLSPAWGIPFDLAVVIAIACSVLAIAATSTTERQRATWSLLPIAVLFAFYGTYSALVVFQTDYGVATELAIGLNLAYVIVPIVLTYVALSRRMIDIGFVLNKATVFAIVSGFVIGVFILIEWAANDWLTHESHTTSAIVGMIIALGLGLSMRYIHGAADHLVDRVFFRKRHEDEKALRGFAHEASFITDPQILLERAAGAVKEHTSADNVAIYVGNGASNYTASNGSRQVVGENDPGIVALRAWGKPIHLHDLSASQLNGELAFPMISRGRLVGTLVCGPKRDGEAYAPDEYDALVELAHGVGTTFDTLSTTRPDVDRETEEKLNLILAKLTVLDARNGGPARGRPDNAS
jgi:hypothetical protein